MPPPVQVTSALDRLVEPLQGTLQAKVKADAGGAGLPASASEGAGAVAPRAAGLAVQQPTTRMPGRPGVVPAAGPQPCWRAAPACALRTRLYLPSRWAPPPLPPAVKQEVDRNEDMLRSCLRAIDALAKLPSAMQVGGAARNHLSGVTACLRQADSFFTRG